MSVAWSRPSGWSRRVTNSASPISNRRCDTSSDDNFQSRRRLHRRVVGQECELRRRRCRHGGLEREPSPVRKLERRLKTARDAAEEAKRRFDAAREAYEDATHEVARIEEQLS